MTEKMTSISLKGKCTLQERGYLNKEEMIQRYKNYAQSQKEIFDKILSTPDNEFVIEQHTGIHKRRNIRKL